MGSVSHFLAKAHAQANPPVNYVGELVDRIKGAVMQFGFDPHSPICIRIGEDGPEMQIEHVKVTGGVTGPRMILQAKVR